MAPWRVRVPDGVGTGSAEATARVQQIVLGFDDLDDVGKEEARWEVAVAAESRRLCCRLFRQLCWRWPARVARREKAGAVA